MSQGMLEASKSWKTERLPLLKPPGRNIFSPWPHFDFNLVRPILDV